MINFGHILHEVFRDHTLDPPKLKALPSVLWLYVKGRQMFFLAYYEILQTTSVRNDGQTGQRMIQSFKIMTILLNFQDHTKIGTVTERFF